MNNKEYKKADSKYYQTSIKIDEAFLSILEHKDFEYISVKEICLKAKVHRSTFYLHYETLNELLLETSEYINSKFDSYFENIKLDLSKMKESNLEEFYLITPKYLTPYLSFVEDNKKLYQTIIKRYSLLNMKSNYNFILNKIAIPLLTYQNETKEDAKYIFEFYVAGTMSIITSWLKEDCKKDKNEIINLIIKCCKTKSN